MRPDRNAARPQPCGCAPEIREALPTVEHRAGAVVDGLQSEFDGQIGLGGIGCQEGRAFLINAAGAGGNRQADRARQGKRFAIDGFQPFHRRVSIRKCLQIRNIPCIRPFREFFDSSGILCGKAAGRDLVAAAPRRTERASARPLCAVTVRAGESRIERHTRHTAAELLLQVIRVGVIPFVVRGVWKRVHGRCLGRRRSMNCGRRRRASSR